MGDDNRFKVTMQDLEKVRVPVEDQVEELDTAQPAPDVVDAEERARRNTILNAPG